jgi:uncharacterized protein DUF6988
MDQGLRANIHHAEEMHQLVSEQLSGTHSGGVRIVLAATFISMAMSHHKSILVLLQVDGLVGSAFALFRPLVEAIYRGLFTAFLANDSQVEKIRIGEESYPRFSDLAKSLDGLPNTDGFFSAYSGKTWSTLCGYTHTGLEQLCQRIDSNGIIKANYDLANINQMVNSSTAVLVVGALSLLELEGKQQAWSAISQRYMSLFGVPTS